MNIVPIYGYVYIMHMYTYIDIYIYIMTINHYFYLFIILILWEKINRFSSLGESSNYINCLDFSSKLCLITRGCILYIYTYKPT